MQYNPPMFHTVRDLSLQGLSTPSQATSEPNSQFTPSFHYIHIAIMRSSWNLIPKILKGIKTVESRWYKIKACPWGRIFPGDTLYFKDSGKPVTVKARVTRVEEYILENPSDAIELFLTIKNQDLGVAVSSLREIPKHILEYITGERYAIFVHFDQVERLKKPFNVNKKGFGSQAGWLCVEGETKLRERNILNPLVS